MNDKIITLFENLWQQYVHVTPTALKIHDLFGGNQYSRIANDHIALRTFNIKKVGLEKLAQHFLALGYKECGQYHFEEKKLFAKHYEHADKHYPKVFISELLVEKFSIQLQEIVHELLARIDDEIVSKRDFLHSGRHWHIDYSTYLDLLKQSEYAAWLAAWGYRANHFTISVNDLKDFDTLEAVNNKLKESGFILNSAGGEIKGSKDVLLEQSSTLADEVMVEFSNTMVKIPSCFYEFALRYVKKDGELYSGFVASSADKIFESTHVR